MTDKVRAAVPALPRRAAALLRRAVTFELTVWRSLYRWILRRPRTAGTNAEAFGYAAANTPVIWTFIILTAIEIPGVHLLLPWPTARLVALVLGVQGLIWMVGFLASLKVHPHVVSDEGLRVRNGGSLDIAIPWETVAEIRARTRSLPSGRTIQYDRTGPDPALLISVLSQTNVDVTLRRPTPVRLPGGSSEPVAELRLYADDPAALVARATAALRLDLGLRNTP